MRSSSKYSLSDERDRHCKDEERVYEAAIKEMILVQSLAHLFQCQR